MPSLPRRAVLALGLLVTLVAAPPALAQARKPVVVFAAASLQTALDAAAAAWKAETGKSVTVSYAASSALARQIEQGAPADLFASADLDWMDHLDRKGLVRTGTRRNLLGNTLVLVEPASAPASSLTIAPGFPLAAAIGGSRLATGNPQSVPVGRYAQAALTTLGVWAEVGPRVAGADNVRAALALVARGEARFGIVYATDARVEPKVRVVGTFPAASHPPIVYPFALTADAASPDAEAFLAWLSSPQAVDLFTSQGFSVVR